MFSRLKPYAPEDIATTVYQKVRKNCHITTTIEFENAKFDLTKENYERSQQLL
ncbi:hypothetical protein [Cloacibacterium normanense]